MATAAARPSLLANLARFSKQIYKDPHPTASPSYPADWRAQWRRMGHAAMLYFPMCAAVLFWPYAVRAGAKPGGFGYASPYFFGGSVAWWE